MRNNEISPSTFDTNNQMNMHSYLQLQWWNIYVSSFSSQVSPLFLSSDFLRQNVKKMKNQWCKHLAWDYMLSHYQRK